jgi:opacity protein-like surface antigen
VRFRLSAVVAATLLLGAAATASAQQSSSPASPREGVTVLLNLGYGYQQDAYLPHGEGGLAGLNLGIGKFMSSDVALWFRASTTNVAYETFRQVSGVGAVGVQYWPIDRFNLEGGLGLGFWNDEVATEIGFGMVLGAGLVLLSAGAHNLQLGVEYAPAFTRPEPVHNLGITLGYQHL